METLERQDFRERFGKSPAEIARCDVGESVEYNGVKLTVKKIQRDKNGFEMILINDGKKNFMLDLYPHWERGPEGDIHLCREGAMNLVKAVYAQTERDYEQLYLGGEKECLIERLPGENAREYEARRKSYYSTEMKKCEEFLGKVFVKYAKVRALWKISHDVNYIAEKLNEKPYHIACLVDRLGLNRADSDDTDDELY